MTKVVARKRIYTLADGDRALVATMRQEHQAVLLAEGSYDEIAGRLGIPIGTVRSRLHRARAELEALKAPAAAQ